MLAFPNDWRAFERPESTFPPATIMVVSPAGILSTDPVVLSTAVSVLKRVGSVDDARRLAVEGALAVTR